MNEEQKFNNAIIVVGKPPQRIDPGVRIGEFDSIIAGKILELVATGESLVVICKMEEMPNLLTVRMWELKNPEFMRQMRVAGKLRGRYQYEKRAAFLKELEGEIWKVTEKGKRYMDQSALDKYMKHSERFSMVSDEEQDLNLRRMESVRAGSQGNGSGGGSVGGVPKVEIKNPFKGTGEVDIEQYRVENFEETEDE